MKLLVKRVFDIVISLCLLFLFLPVIIIVPFILFNQNNGSVFFYQIRPGRNEKLFKIIKFRTMTDKRNDKGVLLPDNLRLTKFGKVLRKLSIDEIPQLLNVLKGEMSLIGPRPLLLEYLPLYNDYQKKRHLVKPGITGWAQVNGRNNLSWEKKFEFDVWYVENQSFMLDVLIFFLTIKKVFISEGINQERNLTMNQFKGNI